MAKLVIVGVLLAGALLLVAAIWPQPSDPYRDYIAMQQAQLQLQQQAADQARWNGFWDVALPLGGILAGVVLAGGVFFAGLALWERRRPIITLTTTEASIPIDRGALHRGAYAQMPYAVLEYQTQAAISRGAGVPHSLTISPHYANRQDVQGAPPAQLAAGPPPIIPTLGQAIEQGLFRTGQYLQGFTLEGQPLYLAPDVGRSLLAAGQGGSGKSTLVAGAALQELLIPLAALGVPGLQEPPRYYIIDPAAHRPQALMQRLRGIEDRVLGVARTPAEVQALCRAFMAEGRQRIDAGITPGHRWPFVLLADEVSMIYDDPSFEDVLPDLNSAFLRANTQFRAVAGKATAGVHLLPAHAFGGKSTIRRSFSARAAGRLDPGDGEIMGLKPATARTLPSLAPGHFILTAPGMMPTEGIACNVATGDVDRALDAAGLLQRARTVHPVNRSATVADLESAAPDGTNNNVMISAEQEDRGLPLTDSWWDVLTGGRQATGPAPDFTPTSAPAGNPEGSPEGNAGAGGRQPAGNPEGNAAAGDPTAVRIFALFMGAGADLPTIVEQIYGVSSTTGGRRYSAALRTAQQLLRDEIARRRAPYEGEAI